MSCLSYVILHIYIYVMNGLIINADFDKQAQQVIFSRKLNK